jgi:hypothetical protein
MDFLLNKIILSTVSLDYLRNQTLPEICVEHKFEPGVNKKKIASEHVNPLAPVPVAQVALVAHGVIH